ncbi:putative DNA exonuclease [Aeromonas phage LAh2]|uniref:Putative DNA exonuclease n=1 Tax=Aeromonas phage LAh1 TaxID=2591024 RepID=A0A513ZZ25_9CAUD|nr:putative DNA exonuclease [Aeromonas phage LAh1]QDH46290.1 putative DNA exonuclease [Aeromonas phage LAh2]QDH46335.1 putative DNA exonuclease [Aeromonas phage LAh3]QDH46385.1 putative DNA exonuclease [Aeromonas phage LAh4]QDH46437.1 putative DNA exonuclease [Aeromonas phage LAh5]
MLPERLRGRAASAAPMFQPGDKFGLLAYDADSAIYRIAATTNSLETAKRRFIQDALTKGLLANADIIRCHLTPKHCTKAGRFTVLAQKPYQGNRKSGTKPPMVEPLRYAIGRKMLELPPEVEIVFNDTFEADDTVIMDGVEWGDDCVIFSEDKDLLCTRNRMLDKETWQVLPGVPLNSIGTLDLKELSSSRKVVGRGPLFFWAQLMMGDTADNIKGLLKFQGKQCGPVATFLSLETFIGTSTELPVAYHVMSAYKAINQNPWPEGWLLWLYPKKGYTFYHHCKAIGLFETDIGPWLMQQFKSKWFDKELSNAER